MGYSSLMQRLSQSFARDYFETLSQVSQVSQLSQRLLFCKEQVYTCGQLCPRCRNCPSIFASPGILYSSLCLKCRNCPKYPTTYCLQEAPIRITRYDKIR